MSFVYYSVIFDTLLIKVANKRQTVLGKRKELCPHELGFEPETLEIKAPTLPLSLFNVLGLLKLFN